jgi:predicted nucleic acid-binding Zn ribbon protein
MVSVCSRRSSRDSVVCSEKMDQDNRWRVMFMHVQLFN